METAACSKFHFVKELSMTPVRQRMTEDMQVRNLSPHTQASYIQQVSLFARYFGKSPEVLGSEEIRAYQVYLTNEKKLASSSILIAVSALRFLYKVTLHRDWALEDIIPSPKKPHKLPVVLSPEEVLHFLDCVAGPKHRTILTTCYAAGLRISEAIRLRAIDIDSQRMMIRVEQGKGQKDRYVMLSPKLLETLRNWWRAAKPKPWLFPGDIPGGHIHREAVELACQKARRCCGIAKPITPHSMRHYAEFRTMPSRHVDGLILSYSSAIELGIVRTMCIGAMLGSWIFHSISSSMTVRIPEQSMSLRAGR
jgi:site-specific recombinase XerD